MQMPELLDKGYDPGQVEEKWYRFWMDNGYFHADETDSERKPFTIVLPLPNVTGTLHIGHALMTVIQDMIVRWKRMQGYNALWMPGTDHAGIATQMVVERDLLVNEGKSRHDLGREKFLERVWTWKEAKGGIICDQLKILGASLDWDREAFTMDEARSHAVREAFVRLYEEGLIYRADRLINWCPVHQTALSDLEVDHEDVQGELWHFAYPLADGSGEIEVATTRPETMLGDTAVAVHPDDPRYTDMIGKNVRHPLLGYEFAIIADAELVDMTFGTGAVKVTPAHDPNDFETGQRHNLKIINLLNPDGTYNENAGPYAGMDRFDVREAVKRDIEAKGFARGSEPYTISLGKSQRSGAVVEPYISKQWFMDVKPLAEKALKAVQDGETVIVPDMWTKVYYEWMTNIRDWCISRQLWWGHRIPAFYCEDCGHITVSRTDVDACEKCKSANIRQDEDVLDTWFSSALWPFSTLGWPENSQDLTRFYPNDMMETGFDILFFWVARMMMMGIHFLGKPPFHTIYLHAMVRDHEGKKMSKSLGNIIDPLDVIYGIEKKALLEKRERDAKALGIMPKQIQKIVKATEKLFPDGIPKSGADALRFFLLSMLGAGRDIKLDIKRVEGYRFFANKIWNASRFAMMNLEDYDPESAPDPESYSMAERWILARMRKTAMSVNDSMEQHKYDQAAMAVYHFFWDEFCDWYIELAKPALYDKENVRRRAATQQVLWRVLESALRLLHPFMSFVTEEIWQKLPKPASYAERLPKAFRDKPSIMIAPYPGEAEFVDAAAYDQDEADMTTLQSIIGSLRNIRGECGIDPGKRIPAVMLSTSEQIRDLVEAQRKSVTELARLENLEIVSEFVKSGPVAKAVVSGAELFIPLKGIIDIDEEIRRAENQLAKAEKELAGVEGRLASDGFVSRAPAEVVDAERARLEDLKIKREKLAAHIAELKG
jgi:valyl-tRNA synthetase